MPTETAEPDSACSSGGASCGVSSGSPPRIPASARPDIWHAVRRFRSTLYRRRQPPDCVRPYAPALRGTSPCPKRILSFSLLHIKHKICPFHMTSPNANIRPILFSRATFLPMIKSFKFSSVIALSVMISLQGRMCRTGHLFAKSILASSLSCLY